MKNTAETNTEKSLKPGDVVTHVSDSWGGETQTIERINVELFPDDPVAFFVHGGFWRTSRLRKVEAA